MDRKRNIHILIAVMLILGLLIGGCGSGNQTNEQVNTRNKEATGNKGNTGNTDNAGNSQPKTEPTTVTFWYDQTGVGQEAIKKMIEAFEEKHDHIKVDGVYIAKSGGESISQKLLISIAGGNPPDVAYFDRFLVSSYAAEGALLDLTERAEQAGISPDDYYPHVWEEAHYEGKMYAVPLNTDARMMYYNKDVFAEAGLDPEQPPRTIAELDKVADQLFIKTGNRIERIGFIPWLDQGGVYAWGWSFGGDFYNKESKQITTNDPKIVEALEWMGTYADKYNIEHITSFTDSTGTMEQDPFLTGQIAMTVGTNAKLGNINMYKPDLNFGIFPMPTPSGDDHTTWSGGGSFVMPRGATNQDAAWELLQFLGSEESQRIYIELVQSFAANPKVNEEVYDQEDPIIGQFVKILDNAHNRPTVPVGALMSDELKKAPDRVARNKGSAQEVLDEMTELLNNELQKVMK